MNVYKEPISDRLKIKQEYKSIDKKKTKWYKKIMERIIKKHKSCVVYIKYNFNLREKKINSEKK